MRERHLDEAAPHEHIISMAYDKNGKLAGSRIVNLKTFAKLNRDYPKKMQEKGWPVDELKAYDPEAVKDMTDEEKKAYKEELIKKKQAKKHGLSANAYAAMKDAEKANELRHALEDENQRLNDEVNEKLGDFEDVQKLVAHAKEELAELEPKRTQAKKDIEDAKEKKQDVFDAVYALKNAMGMTSVYDNALIIAKAKEWADEFEEREAEIKQKESLIATWNAKAKEKLTEAQSILDDAKDVEGNSDKLQKALEYMEKIRFKDGTTAKARFEDKYGTKSKVTRAYIQSSVNDLLDRIGQKQSDDDSYDYH
jgi:DNA repair exonuclease SbcCD ATPase subunit